MRGARPLGCRLRRSTLTGGRSKVASAPTRRGATARLEATSIQCRSMASAGYGSCPLSTKSTALRAFSSAGSASWRSGKIGAYPAATRRTLRSRKGTSSCAARWRTISRLGCERPVSRKLKWRVEISASQESSSWLKRRRWRHSRRRSPTGCADAIAKRR